MSEFRPSAPVSVFPGHEKVTVPDFCRKSALEGLPPGEAIFPYNSSFAINKTTGVIHLRGSALYDTDDSEPSFIAGRVGLARVYEVIDGKVVDGFIADFRYADPGLLQEEEWTADPTDFASNYVQDARERNKPVALMAAGFTDLDGVLHYRGDHRLVSHLNALVTETDAVVARLNPTQSADVQSPIYCGQSGVPGEFLG